LTHAGKWEKQTAVAAGLVNYD